VGDVARPWTATPEGVLLTVRLTPKGGDDRIDGVERMADGRAVLKGRVRAAPSDGEANMALTKLIARRLEVAPKAVTLVSGATARIKRLQIEGDPAALSALLERIAGAGP
jgi:uncharacterized protein YggU (UPF0235/DUF167 family)